jgi:hypothetical protein
VIVRPGATPGLLVFSFFEESFNTA